MAKTTKRLEGCPTVADLAKALVATKTNLDYCPTDTDDEDTGWLDVRLQVHGGGWQLWTGDSQYDTDHRGCWGMGSLSKRTNCQDLAKDLIDEARDAHAMRGNDFS